MFSFGVSKVLSLGMSKVVLVRSHFGDELTLRHDNEQLFNYNCCVNLTGSLLKS